MKILVTGSSGFIGHALVRKLAHHGHEVIGLDRIMPPSLTGWSTNAPLLDGTDYTFVQAELPNLNPNYLPLDIDWCVHLAGQSSAEESMRNPRIEFQNNLEALARITELPSLANSGLTFASSMAVYGNRTGAKIAENSELRPASLYGWSKLYGERYIDSLDAFRGRSSLLRFFNVYGPGQNLNRMNQGMVSIYLSMLARDGAVKVKGSLERVRDFIYLDDVVDAISHSVVQNLISPINISTGLQTSVQSLLDIIAEKFGANFPIDVLPATPGDVFGFSGATDLAARDLSWKSKVTLSKGISKTIKDMDWKSLRGA
jgi:UDP-glucose 4-epimerase